ncbi:hypothetical protein Pyn_34740 [Prunus yedoensis var. nudiflora]|uniref:Uncharacterized protein n=1 Tax=Prunus yedoensis var. nudiflora TaxID=2094558 RepID=A0A314ZGL7_PRUYE|nr:hypothetical protein Pyn_34740 [Prunus yedoensis var. nudiflora]
MDRVSHVPKFKNQAPRVLRKVCEALGRALVSFTNKTDICLQINIMAWPEKLMAWELSIHEFSIRERKFGFLMRKRGRGEGNLGRFVEGSEEEMRMEEWVA